MSRLDKSIRRQYRRKLEAKLTRLAELEEAYRNAKNDASRNSFKGKITRAKRDIEIFRSHLK